MAFSISGRHPSQLDGQLLVQLIKHRVDVPILLVVVDAISWADVAKLVKLPAERVANHLFYTVMCLLVTLFWSCRQNWTEIKDSVRLNKCIAGIVPRANMRPRLLVAVSVDHYLYHVCWSSVLVPCLFITRSW